MRDIILKLESIITPANVLEPEILELLRQLTIQEREDLSFRTRTRVVYLGEEVDYIKRIEENAVLKAAPVGFDLSQLNGLNIGCGSRRINEFLIPVDANRGERDNTKFNGSTSSAVLSSLNNIPFQNESIDYVVALHVLEHSSNPLLTLAEWFRLLKPGGGIGVILPDWRYNWDASRDRYPYGHRWNCTPDNTALLLEEFVRVKRNCSVEYINTYKYKMSFDFVLRKEGKFEEVFIDLGFTGYELGNEIGCSYYVNWDGTVIATKEEEE